MDTRQERQKPRGPQSEASPHEHRDRNREEDVGEQRATNAKMSGDCAAEVGAR
jgi:hypothetical protein